MTSVQRHRMWAAAVRRARAIVREFATDPDAWTVFVRTYRDVGAIPAIRLLLRLGLPVQHLDSISVALPGIENDPLTT